MITIENIKNTDTITPEDIQNSDTTILKFANVDSVNKFPYDKLPQLDTIIVNDNVLHFNLSELYACKNIEKIVINNYGYNDTITITGKLPESVANSLDDNGWFMILTYRPDLYNQIPSRMFDNREFQADSVEAVLNGMRKRLSLLPKEKYLDQKSKDVGLLERIKDKILVEKAKREKPNNPLFSSILDVYAQYEEELT